MWPEHGPVPRASATVARSGGCGPSASTTGGALPLPVRAKQALRGSHAAQRPTSSMRSTVIQACCCVVVHSESGTMASQRVHHGDQIPGRRPCIGPDRCPEITGPLNEQIAGAVAFAARNMQVAARKDPARSDLPQYSEKAVFEALVNAVVHRDYSMTGSKIRLSMFADRLEIQSPGSLPNNLSVESMASRQSTRNEALTSVLARMPVGGTRGGEDRRYFMERRGDGVPIIRRETWELCGKYPRLPGGRRFGARNHGRAGRGGGRSAHDAAAHDRVRVRAGTCRAFGAGIGHPANERLRSISLPCRKAGVSFSRGDRSPSRIEGQAESHPRYP